MKKWIKTVWKYDKSIFVYIAGILSLIFLVIKGRLEFDTEAPYYFLLAFCLLILIVILIHANQTYKRNHD